MGVLEREAVGEGNLSSASALGPGAWQVAGCFALGGDFAMAVQGWRSTNWCQGKARPVLAGRWLSLNLALHRSQPSAQSRSRAPSLPLATRLHLARACSCDPEPFLSPAPAASTRVCCSRLSLPFTLNSRPISLTPTTTSKSNALGPPFPRRHRQSRSLPIHRTPKPQQPALSHPTTARPTRTPNPRSSTGSLLSTVHADVARCLAVASVASNSTRIHNPYWERRRAQPPSAPFTAPPTISPRLPLAAHPRATQYSRSDHGSEWRASDAQVRMHFMPCHCTHDNHSTGSRYSYVCASTCLHALLCTSCPHIFLRLPCFVVEDRRQHLLRSAVDLRRAR